VNSIKIEFFYAQGCKRCAAARDQLRAVALDMPGAQWEEVDVAKEPERAVEVGVLSTPALLIDGELVFKSMPKPDELRAELDVRFRR
jgi:thioredoxin 1